MEKVGGSRIGVEGALSLSLSLPLSVPRSFSLPYTHMYTRAYNIYIYLSRSLAPFLLTPPLFPPLSLSPPPQLVTRSIRGLHLLLLFTSTFVNHLAPAFAGPFILPEATYIPRGRDNRRLLGYRDAWLIRIHNSLRGVEEGRKD